MSRSGSSSRPSGGSSSADATQVEGTQVEGTQVEGTQVDVAPVHVAPVDRTWVDALLSWHDPAARDLPWRDPAATPWEILLSEIAAQQTQAERAAGAWRLLVERFGTPSAMAAAPVSDVLEAWQGLGYNRRALNLHRAAVAITADHGGEVPADLDALLALPGIGPYTARAVMAFAFDAAEMPVDTNVSRVLSRVLGRPLTRAEAQDLADRAVAAEGDGAEGGGDGVEDRDDRRIDGRAGEVRGRSAAALAAAMMDLGASSCGARSWSCDDCPLAADHCAWVGGPEPDPAAASAHRSRPQGRFEGSARQARGRLIDAARSGPVPEAVALDVAGDHGMALVEALVAEGLLVAQGDWFVLPGWSGKAEDGRAAQRADPQEEQR